MIDMIESALGPIEAFDLYRRNMNIWQDFCQSRYPSSVLKVLSMKSLIVVIVSFL